MSEQTMTTPSMRSGGNGAAATSTSRELGLLPTWVSAGVGASSSGAVALFGTLQDVRTEARQLTGAVLHLIEETSKIGLRLAGKVADRADTLAASALNAAERATRAPMELLS